MRKKILLLLLSIFLISSINGQNAATYNYFLEDGPNRNLQLVVKIFWEKDYGNGSTPHNPRFQLVPFQAAGNLTGASVPIAVASSACDRMECRIVITGGLNSAQTYVLSIDFDGHIPYQQAPVANPKRYWGTVKFAASAEIIASADANKKKSEIVVKANAPISSNIAAQLPVDPNNPYRSFQVGDKVPVKTSRLLITNIVAQEDTNPNQIATVTDVDRNEVTLKLDNKVMDGVSKTFIVDTLTLSEPAAGGATLQQQPGRLATGKIDIPGLAIPPADPKLSITVKSEAAKISRHNLLINGSVAFRTPKFASLFGRYSFCGETVERERRQQQQQQLQQPPPRPDNRALDYRSEECRSNRGLVESFFFGQSNTERSVYFAGIEPKVTFDIGSDSSQTKNTITGELPFVTYFHFSRRNVLADNDFAGLSGIKLHTYGGWSETPWYRLASVKLSVGPKLDLYKNKDDDDSKWYSFNPKDILANVRTDFEFHRWLGTIAEKTRLIKADFDAVKKGNDMSRLDGPNFGWKFVPYLAFEGGTSFEDDPIEQPAASLLPDVTVPKYRIARFKIGGEGKMEWLIKKRVFSITGHYALFYLSLSEKNSFKSEGEIFLKSVRGYHPYFKTSFELSLDPAKRWYFTTAWENGLSLPGLEQLNKLSSGITIKR